MNTGTKLVGHSRNDDFRTPDYLWRWLDWRFDFDFDAAATHQNTKCRMYATQDGTFSWDISYRVSLVREQTPEPIRHSNKDGLTTSWEGRRVFCNPPYSRPLLGQFIDKAIAERDNAIIVMLVKCDTSTQWWQRLAAHSHIEFLSRVAYLDQNGKPMSSATFASCIAILRPTEPNVRR